MPANIRTLAAIFVLGLIASSGIAEDWTRFRGPNGSGVSASTNLPVEFGPDKNVNWSTEIPFARSSPVFAKDRIFLTAIDGEGFITLALDRESGEVLWQRQIERARVDTFHQATDSASPSPVTDGSNVYAFFQETGLVSYTAEGEKRWELGLGPFRNFYGIAASPVLAGDTLLQLCDQATGSFLLAVDKNSGRELWRQDRSARTLSYTTPILYPDSRNPRDVIVLGDKWVDAYDLRSGKSRWSLGGVGAGPVSSPILDGDMLFISHRPLSPTFPRSTTRTATASCSSPRSRAPGWPITSATSTGTGTALSPLKIGRLSTAMPPPRAGGSMRFGFRLPRVTPRSNGRTSRAYPTSPPDCSIKGCSTWSKTAAYRLSTRLPES